MNHLAEEATERDNEQPESHIHTILEHWTCNRKGCHNHSKHCFIDSINGSKHLPINSDDVRNWNIDILSGKATIETSSDHVCATMLSKSGRHSEKMKTRPQQEPTIIINNYTQSNSSRCSYQSVLHGNSEENVESSPPNHMSLKSFPVPSDSDPDTDIDAYINWHICKTSKHEDFLNDVKAKLLTEDMTLKTL